MKPFVHTLSRPLLAAAATLALALSAFAPAVASADPPLDVQTAAATAVTDTTATLNGVIDPHGNNRTSYRFRYGITGYDTATPITELPGAGNGPRAVSATITGLTPATTYHFRLFAGDGHFPGAAAGDDVTFTTASGPPPATTTAAPAAAPAPVAVPTLPASLPSVAPTPELGKTVTVAPVSGTVKVKAPGAAGFVVLGAGGTVPSGAVVDTRAGEVALTTALPGGKTQTAQFHGGVFGVRQSPTAGGTTEIDLRGPALGCPTRKSGARARARAAAAVPSKAKPPKRRKLWGSDKGGRFRTHGRNSVATVRGTRWVTTDTCAGTRTTVTAGAVSVRDTRRKRTVLVRAGHTYLARSR
jgi:hypothetical protein